MKPHVVCLMMSSVDGRLHASRWSKSPDGNPATWSALYEAHADTLDATAWLVGRTTMAEMSKAESHPVPHGGPPQRPLHKAEPAARHFAIAVDTSGSLHFHGPTIHGSQVIVLLGARTSDDHLRELAGDGVSYIVSDRAEVDLGDMLETLSREFGIHRLVLEGGAAINGSFFAAGLVDELQVLVCPGLDGHVGAPGIIENGERGLTGAVELAFVGCEPMKLGCVLLRYAVHRGRIAEGHEPS